MNFDRNTIMGFLVLALLFVGYFWWTSKEQAANRKEKARQDSITYANRPKEDTATLNRQSARNDSISKAKTGGAFQGAINGPEQLKTINTDLLAITFSSRGGQPKRV